MYVLGLGSNVQGQTQGSEPRACALSLVHTQIISWQTQEHETNRETYVERRMQRTPGAGGSGGESDTEPQGKASKTKQNAEGRRGVQWWPAL